MNLLNPKVMIFFLAFFPAFLWEPEGNTVQQFYILGGVFMLVSFLVFGSIAVLAGYISKFLKEDSRLGVLLKWLQILVFVGIAMYILL
jgi:threonine/homoserine/homoserine lactone efflux protein